MLISLFGLELFCPNKGCEALCHSLLDLLSSIAIEKNQRIDVVVNMKWKGEIDLPEIPLFWKGLDISINIIDLKNNNSRKRLKEIINESDYCIDFTGGDSFTDLYGLKRFVYFSLIKTYIILKKRKLILGPQTYGPYKNFLVKKWAAIIINNSYKVYSRDNDSSLYVKTITKKNISSLTDIALSLRPRKCNYTIQKTNRIKVGINISGLLYNGGYTRNNQFGLLVDYQEYIKRLIKELLALNYEIFLIPHVISYTYENIENDLKICNEMKQLDSSVHVVDNILLPSELKYVISQLDFFTGARMHSTVAAFSTSVPVLPFSYSKKFKGLYGALGYNHLIEGREMTTDEAIKLTINSIKNRDLLKKDVISAYEKAQPLLDVFIHDLSVLGEE